MNYLFPLDTYFAAPLSEIITDTFAMPVLNKVKDSVAFFFSSRLSTESVTKWSDRTIRYIDTFGIRKPTILTEARSNPLSTRNDLASATFLTVSENTTLFATRTTIRACTIKGIFGLVSYSVAPLFGNAIAESYAANSKFIQTAHSVATYGVWFITLLAVKWM